MRIRYGSFLNSFGIWASGKPFIPADVSEDGEEEFRIVRTKRFSLKPMTPEEAILQMNLLEHEFFVFLNMEDNDSFSVVYKRNEGGYGLISAADV